MKLFVSLICMILFASTTFAATKQDSIDFSGKIMATETNKPVAGAIVKIFAETKKVVALSPLKTVVSADDGSFKLQLASGNYVAMIDAEGFPLVWQQYHIQAKAKNGSTTFYLNKSLEVSGKLIDKNGNPLAGITVKAGKWRTAKTGSDGRFKFERLNPDSYVFNIDKAGWQLERNYYSLYEAKEKVDLGKLIVSKETTLVVKANILKDDNKNKLENITVEVSSDRISRSAKLDSKGVARITKLLPGKYSLYSYDERIIGKEYSFEVIEGTTSNELDITLKVKPPSLSIEQYNDVFLPNKPVKLRAHSLWVEKAVLVIRSKAEQSGSAFTTISKPITFKSVKSSHFRRADIQIPALPAGLYSVELHGNGAIAKQEHLVTRLGIVAKSSAKEVLLYATDLISGESLPGVKIRFSESGKQVITDSNGLAKGRLSAKPQKLSAVSGDNMATIELAGSHGGQSVAEPGGDDSTADAESARSAASDQKTKGYLYTDRPAYRPDQTVYFKGVVRQRSGESYATPKSGRAKIVVTDSTDAKICESELEISANGSFNGECKLSDKPVLGSYQISANSGKESWSGNFKVLEYRKPEFEVKVVSEKRFLVDGDTAAVKINARYYFGAPVADGKVKWRMYSQPAWGVGVAGNNSLYDDENDYSASGYSDFSDEGELTLDSDGAAIIPVTANHHENPFSYTVEVDVTDTSSRQVSSSGSLIVVPSLVSVGVTSESYLSKPGEKVGIHVVTADWDDKPLSTTVKLSFERQKYDKKSKSYLWVTNHTTDLTTDAFGRAESSFEFPESGYWNVKVEAADKTGRKSVDSTSVWVWKDGYDWQGSYRNLQAEFDKKMYKPGETARLIVRSPITGGNLLLSLEGRDVISYKTVPLKSVVQVIDIPVTEKYAPYVYVSAVAVGEGRFFNKTLNLQVDHQPGKLDLKVKPDKAVYAPGDKVRLTLSSETANKPVPAELSIAVVDEAIFAVSPERKDDIYQFFLGTREHFVTTQHSFPSVYLGGASKAAPAAFMEKDDLKGVKVRKVFKDTAYWLPTTLTNNPDGSATAEFMLPDNLTTWRATAIGHNANNEFGTTREKFIARLDLMARLSPPRFLTVGDELKIPGVITSMTDTTQNVSGRFESKELTLLAENSFSGDVLGHGNLRKDILLRGDIPGSATLKLIAQTTGRQDKKGDAMELTLPVFARGITRSNDGSITLREESETAELNLPSTAMPGMSRLKINFAPTIAEGLNSAINKLVDFPYGCVEQTLSRFIPAVYAKQLLEKNAWKPDAETEQKLPRVIAEGLKRLADMQHEDGGWGWWKTDSTSMIMTSHVIYGLGLAKKAGFAIPEEMLSKGFTSLRNQMETASSNDLPRAYRALITVMAPANVKRSKTLEQYIENNWEKLTVADKLAITETLITAGQTEMVRPLLNELKNRVKSEGNAAYIMDESAESWWYGWHWGSSAVETTSSLLSQILVQSPNDPLAPKLAEFLNRRKTGGWWQTTTASASAITALVNYISASGETSGDYTAKLSINGNEVAGYQVKNGALKSGEKQIIVPSSGLKNGANSVKLIKNGEGVAYLSTSLEYLTPPELAQSSEGMELVRKLYLIKSVKDKDNNWQREYTPIKEGDTLNLGDNIEVRLTVSNKKNLEYVIIEDRLPAGFEVRETSTDSRFSNESSYFNWYAQKERHDERMSFFITALASGDHEFRYIIYPELEGKIIAMPAAFWPMYQPELRGESKLWQFEVKGRK